MKKFPREELSGNSGESGGAAYIAYEGKVYDVSSSPSWGRGEHQGGLHLAGRDLTGEMEDAPHGIEMLEDFPVIGELEEPA